ncbi:MAG: hypothetical protein ACTSRG_16265 [Candidatus Helarchaeota archaeon]
MSGLTHLVFGFGLGLIILYLTNYRFNFRRVLILGVNNYIGPDLRVLVLGLLLIFLPENVAYDISYYLIHTAYGWPVFSLLIALIYYFFSRYSIEKTEQFWPNIIKLEKPAISYLDCYKLTLAGGLFHFHLDWLFHPNTWQYVAIMSTGNFELPFQPWTKPPIHWSMLLTGIIMLSFGYFFLWIYSMKKWDKRKKFIKSVSLFIGYAIIYLIWLGAWILATGEPLPVGEESDFGQIIFYAITFFFPLIFVATSFERAEFMKKIPTQ